MLVQADLGPNLAMELVEEFQEIKTKGRKWELAGLALWEIGKHFGWK